MVAGNARHCQQHSVAVRLGVLGTAPLQTKSCWPGCYHTHTHTHTHTCVCKLAGPPSFRLLLTVVCKFNPLYFCCAVLYRCWHYNSYYYYYYYYYYWSSVFLLATCHLIISFKTLLKRIEWEKPEVNSHLGWQASSWSLVNNKSAFNCLEHSADVCYQISLPCQNDNIAPDSTEEENRIDYNLDNCFSILVKWKYQTFGNYSIRKSGWSWNVKLISCFWGNAGKCYKLTN